MSLNCSATTMPQNKANQPSNLLAIQYAKDMLLSYINNLCTRIKLNAWCYKHQGYVKI